MSRYKHPMWTGQYEILPVNAIQMQSIMGKDHSIIMAYNVGHLKEGDAVKVQVFTVNDNEATGMWCMRYVVCIEKLTVEVHDNEVFEVQLSAFKL